MSANFKISITLLLLAFLFIEFVPLTSAPSFYAAAGLPAAGGSSEASGKTESSGIFNLPNPLNAKDLTEFVQKLAEVILPLIVAIAVLLIIYAGILMITSRGEKEQIDKGKKTLWYALLGLAVVFIGRGFVSIIESILGLAKK